MKKGLVNVLIANIFYLIINLLINFFIPKYVTIDSYSMIKTYTLYISYAGFFSIGYNDGMYLKYGGKKLEDIDKKELGNNIFSYIFLIFFMFTLLFVISIITENKILIAFSFGVVSYNIINYLKSLYQATGKFDLYGICLNIEKLAVFFLTMLCIFLLHSNNYLLYIWIQVIVGLIISLYLLISLQKQINFFGYGKIDFKEIIINIKSGIILMLGNFSSILFTGLDRWFVKFFLNNFAFAMYSFAASLENIINVFISPITITMYNYFCKKPKKEEIIKIKNITLIYGFFVISFAYPAKFIVESFLTKYTKSISLLFFLFGAQLFYVIIKGIYVNLYKAEKKQNKYLIQLIIMLCTGIILNVILFRIFGSNESIAVATFITALIWFIICEFSTKDYRFKFKEWISIIIILSTYFITNKLLNSIYGFIIYSLIVILVSYVCLNNSFKYLINYGFKYLKSKIKLN